MIKYLSLNSNFGNQPYNYLIDYIVISKLITKSKSIAIDNFERCIAFFNLNLSDWN